MERVYLSHQVHATSDIMSDWRAIDSGFTTKATRDQKNYWKALQRYVAMWNIDPFLQDFEQLNIIIFVRYVLHRFCKVTTERAFKSMLQPLLRHCQPSPRPSTWLENPVP